MGFGIVWELKIHSGRVKLAKLQRLLVVVQCKTQRSRIGWWQHQSQSIWERKGGLIIIPTEKTAMVEHLSWKGKSTDWLKRWFDLTGSQNPPSYSFWRLQNTSLHTLPSWGHLYGFLDLTLLQWRFRFDELLFTTRPSISSFSSSSSLSTGMPIHVLCNHRGTGCRRHGPTCGVAPDSNIVTDRF